MSEQNKLPEDILAKYGWHDFDHSRTEKDCLLAMDEYYHLRDSEVEGLKDEVGRVLKGFNNLLFDSNKEIQQQAATIAELQKQLHLEEKSNEDLSGETYRLRKTIKELNEQLEYWKTQHYNRNKEVKELLEGLKEIRDNPKSWKAGGLGGQDQYAGMPSFLRIVDSLLNKHKQTTS